MGRKREYTEEAIVRALVAKKGMVYHAAEAVGCCADTIYERAKTSKPIRDAIKHERGKVVDSTELKLFDAAVGKGEGWAVQFLLRTIGKDRGYVERQEVTGKDGEPLVKLVKGIDPREVV
jgi:hypothetical protein